MAKIQLTPEQETAGAIRASKARLRAIKGRVKSNTNGEIIVAPDQFDNDFGKILNSKQIIAATAIASGSTLAQAARIAHTKPATISGWKRSVIAFVALIQHINASFLNETRTEASRIMLRRLKGLPARNPGEESAQDIFEWVRLALHITSAKFMPGNFSSNGPPTPAQITHQHLHVTGQPAIPSQNGIPGSISQPSQLLSIQQEAKAEANERKRLMASALADPVVLSPLSNSSLVAIGPGSEIPPAETINIDGPVSQNPAPKKKVSESRAPKSVNEVPQSARRKKGK